MRMILTMALLAAEPAAAVTYVAQSEAGLSQSSATIFNSSTQHTGAAPQTVAITVGGGTSGASGSVGLAQAGSSASIAAGYDVVGSTPNFAGALDQTYYNTDNESFGFGQFRSLTTVDATLTVQFHWTMSVTYGGDDGSFGVRLAAFNQANGVAATDGLLVAEADSNLSLGYGISQVIGGQAAEVVNTFVVGALTGATTLSGAGPADAVDTPSANSIFYTGIVHDVPLTVVPSYTVPQPLNTLVAGDFTAVTPVHFDAGHIYSRVILASCGADLVGAASLLPGTGATCSASTTLATPFGLTDVRDALGNSAPLELVDVTPAIGGVPEPASWALLLTGFGLTGAVMRRTAQPVG